MASKFKEHVKREKERKERGEQELRACIEDIIQNPEKLKNTEQKNG